MFHRNCVMCGKPFCVKRLNQKFCSRKCYRKASGGYQSRENFQEGIVYVLDMNTWKWSTQERGNKND